MYRQLIAIALLLATQSATAQIAPQKSVQGGVTVDVTPTEIGAGAREWTFKVVLDTHSQELADDLVKTAVLVDGAGRETKALGWEGAAPGGHHREGVLRFAAIQPFPAAIELRISRSGEGAPRSFRWQLKQ